MDIPVLTTRTVGEITFYDTCFCGRKTTYIHGGTAGKPADMTQTGYCGYHSRFNRIDRYSVADLEAEG